MSVYKAISSVMSDLSKVGIAKTDTNTYDKYKYRGIDAVYNALAPLLAKHGLCVLPRVLDRELVERSSAKGGVLMHTTLTVEFDLVASEDGSTHTIRAIGEAMDRGDKSVNKAMTAAYKYAMFELFCIPTEGDDADGESHEVTQSEPISDKSRVVANDYAEAMREASTVEALDAVAKELAGAGLPGEVLKGLRAQYGNRKKELANV